MKLYFEQFHFMAIDYISQGNIDFFFLGLLTFPAIKIKEYVFALCEAQYNEVNLVLSFLFVMFT